MPPIEVVTGPCKKQGFELATIFVAPADFQNFWETDSRKLEGVFWGTEPSLHHPSLARCLGATRPRGLSGPLLGPLAASFEDLWRRILGSLLSYLFSLLSSLLSLRDRRFSEPSRHSGIEPLPPSTLSSLGTYPFLYHPAILGSNHCLLRPSHL